MEHGKRAVMFVIAVSLIDSMEKVKQLAWVIAGAAGFLCLDFNLQYFAGVNQANLGYGGLDNNCLAIALVTCLAPAVFLGLSAKPNWQKAIAFGCAALIGHAILLTFSRGGMLGLLVAGATAVIVMPKRPRYFAAVAIAAVVALSIAGPELRDRFWSSFAGDVERDYSAQSRIDLWLDCLTIMRQNPLLGVGPDHFPLVAESFGWNAGKEAHSLWLQLGAELGVPGMLLLLLFYFSVFRRAWPLTKGTNASEEAFWVRNAACMVVVGLAGFALSAQFVSLEGLEVPFYIAALGVGTLKCLTAQTAMTGAALPDPRARAPGKFASTRPFARRRTTTR
jgi:O-antigen ligase